MFLPKLHFSPGRLLLLLALVSAHAALAQEASAAWAHQAWSTEDGLPQNSVHAILQASDGLIWVATEGGLARFDGYTFQPSGGHAPNDDLCCVVQDERGGLWVGTSAGLGHRDSQGFRQVGPSTAVRALAAADDGGVLALIADGLLRADARGITPIDITAATTLGPPTALARAADGGVWIATPAGLLRYTHARLVPTGLPGVLAGSPVLGIAPAAGGALWLRTAHSVALLRPGFPPRLWQAGRDLPGTRIEALLPDPDTGRLWVGTNRGLVTLSNDAGPSTSIPSPELSSASILALTRDTEGDLWVGTETAGLHILRPQRFRTLPGLEDQAITSIVETTGEAAQSTGGAIWLGTREDGLRVVRDRAIARPPASAGLSSQVVLALAAGPHGDLWVGTPDGLNHVDLQGHVTLLSSGNGLPDDFVRSLLPEADGSVWVGTRRGLAHVNGQHVDRILTREDGLRSELIGALLETQEHDLWIATLDGLSLFHNGRITTYTAGNGLAGNVVTSLAPADAPGSLWIGTRDGGLTRWAAGQFVAFHQTGLPASIESMLFHDGSLWMATRKGVLRVAVSALASCAERGPACPLAVSHYGYSDGLPSEDLAALGHPAAAVTRSGELWFATAHGVAVAEPGEDPDRNTPTPIVLDRMEADGVDQALPSSVQSPAQTEPRTDELTLPPGQRSLSFTCAGLSYRAPSRVAYRYRLEGFDAHWVDAGPRRTAFYTNLPPGPYRFLVQAAGSNGLWSDPPAAIRFRILPPIYRRWWFFLLCVALLGGLAYLVYHLRLRRVRAQFAAVLAERNRIAREIHDTLAQDLVAVSLQVEVTTQLVRRGNVAAATQQLERTRRLVQEGIADARESIWELRANTAEASLPSRLARVAERARERGVPTDLHIGGTYRPLPTRWESEILRVAGEAVNNSIRHAEATAITVAIDYAPHQLQLRIVDNGRGFDPAAAPPAGRHFGMGGMRERAENIRGQLHIESAPGAGTTVTLRLPLDTGMSPDPDPAQQPGKDAPQPGKEKRQHG